MGRDRGFGAKSALYIHLGVHESDCPESRSPFAEGASLDSVTETTIWIGMNGGHGLEHMEGNTCLRPGSGPHLCSHRRRPRVRDGDVCGLCRLLVCDGAPDLIVLTLKEFAEQAYRICRAGNLPLMVDADHGYGNALNTSCCGGTGDRRRLRHKPRGH